MCKTNIIEAVI